MIELQILAVLFFGGLVIYLFIAFFFIFKNLKKEERRSEAKKRTIFHITTRESFEKNTDYRFPYGPNPPIKCYLGETLKSENFIHCSRSNQLLLVAKKFKDVSNLILLEIDQEKVIWPVKYEGDGDNKNFYPHIYGPINTTAIVAVHDFVPDKNGNFTLPDFPSNLK